MRKMTRKGLASVLLPALALSLTSAPAFAANQNLASKSKFTNYAATAKPSVLRVTRMGDTSQAFGPTRNSSGNDHFVNFLLFSNLVKIAADEKTILPDLATKWSISKDAKEMTFELRKGVTFHDGTKFTAQDVADTIGLACRLTTTNFIGYKPDRWLEVEGCEALKDKLTGIPSGVTIVNDSNIKIKLKVANAQWIRYITDAVYSIIPTESHKGLENKEWAISDFVVAEPIGTGPYKITKFKRNQYIEFDVNTKYYGAKPSIKKVFWLLNVKPTNILPLLQKNQLDLAIDIDVSNEDQVKKLKTHTAQWNNTVAAQFLQFRADHPVFGDKRVRQAVAYAFDRRTVLKNVFGNNGEIRWMYPAFDQNRGNLDKFEYNPTKAKELLKASGADLTKEYVIMYSPLTDPAWPKIVPILKEQLEAVGLKVKLDPVDQAAWVAGQRVTDPAKATYALTLNSGGSLGLGTARGSGFFNCASPTFSFYAKCDIPELYKKLFEETDKAEIAKIEDQLAKIVQDEMPFFTTWTKQTLNAVSKNLAGTFKLYPNDRDSSMGITGWQIK